MNTTLLVLLIIYGITSLFIFLFAILTTAITDLPENTVPKFKFFGRFVAKLVVILWCLVPIFRWTAVLCTLYNFSTYGRKEN
jgi:hypothetical protein